MSPASANGPAPLTYEAAERTLRQQGCLTNDLLTLCPSCRQPGLIFEPDNGEPRLECPHGCNAAATVLTLSTMSMPRGPFVDRVEVLRQKLNLPELQRVVKHGRLGDAYELHLDDGKIIEIGNVIVLMTQSKFRAAFMPQARRNPPRYKTAEWDDVAELVEQVAEEFDEVASTAEETAGWIRGYLPSATVRRGVDTANAATLYDLLGAANGDLPAFFDREGRLHLRLEQLVRWLGRIGGVRVTAPELSTRLSRLGFKGNRLAARSGEEIRRARYWVSPPNFEETLR